MHTITVYTKPACVQCNATFRALDKAGILYTKIDLTDNAQARDYLMSLGYLQAPVHLSPTVHWCGYRPDRLAGLDARQCLCCYYGAVGRLFLLEMKTASIQRL